MGWAKVFVVSGLLVSLCSAQGGGSVELSGKTPDYYQILLKRPRPGNLFDRFCNSWLEENDLAKLEQFLSENTEPNARCLLAFYYERMRESKKASDLYAKLIADAPDDVDLVFYKAGVDADLGFYEQAAADVGKLVDRENVDEELLIKALKLQGRCLLRIGKKQEGLAVWQRLLVVSDMDEDVADELTDLLMAEGFYEEALAQCDRMLETERDAYRKVMLLMRRASLLVRMDRRQEAIDGLCDAFTSTGQGSWLQRDLLDRIETLYRGADDLMGLANCCEGMLLRWPDNPELRRAYAGSLLACRKDEAALEVARELIRLVPDSQEIKEWYVGILLDLDRFDEAASLVEGFLARFAADNALRLQLASIHQLRKDNPKTIECILAYLEHSGQTEADYLMAARTLARYELNDEATSIFLEMLAKWPDSLEGREAVAMHMSRESYLHLELAWKHYEWLAKICDLETLLRLDSALKAARRPDWALNILDMRSADFSGEYRYASARYETIASMENQEGLLEQGLRCVDLAGGIEEIQSSVATLLYEVKKQALIDEWIERFSNEDDLAPARLWLLASLHVANRQVEQAAGLLRDAMESNPGNENLVLFRLQLARQERNWDLAESLLVHLIGQFPARQSIWIRELVPVLSQAGRHEKALEWIEEWKKVSPNAVRPYEMERDALLASGKPEEAVLQMRKAVLQFSESKDLKRALGRLYESTGRTKDAEELYWTMLDAEEDLDNRMSLLSDIIAIKQSMGGMNELIRELERRAETARTAAFPLLGLAECYRINNRINERSAVLGQLLELRPGDLTVLRAKASLEEDLGNYDSAKNLMLRIADEDTTGAAFRKLVEFEFMYGDPALAAEMLDDPRLVNDLDSFVELVARFAALGYSPAIDARLTRVMEEHPEDYRLAYLHGINLEKEGKAEEAFRTFAELIQLEDVGQQTNSPSSRPTARTDVQRLIQSGYIDFGRQYSTVSAQWQLQYGAFIPQGLIQMVSLATQQANNARYNGRISSSRSSSTIQRIDVPDNLDELHSMCALQLLETSRKLPEDVRPELDAYLPYAAIMHIDSSNPVNTAEWWNAVEALYPEDEAVHLFRMLAAPHTIEPNGENIQAAKRLAADYPEMALQFFPEFIGRDPQFREQLPDLIRSIGVDDAHLDVAFELVMRAMQFIPQNGSIPAGLKELVDDIVTRIEAREGLDDAYRIRLIAARARMNGDFEPLLAELKNYLQRLENETAIGLRSSSVNISFGGILSLYFNSGLGLSSYSRNNVSVSFYSGLEETSFPPYRLPNGNSINLSFSPESIGMDRQQFFDSLADWSSDSLFGWFTMARMGAESNLLQQVADTIAAKEDKTRNELYALTCWHIQQKEMEQALVCALELCDQAADDPIWKTTFDRFLLRVLAQVQEIPESIKPALAERAESLWDSVWVDSSMSFQLVEMMEKLELPLDGIVERAQKLVAQNASSSLVSRSVTRTSVARKDVYQQVVEQFDRGETESALVRVAVMLRSEALKTLYPSGTQSQSNYQLRNCIQHILQRNLGDAFLAQFEPPEGGVDARRKYEYAYALETMGRSGDAFPLYREVYSIRPDWVGAKIRYCAGLMPTDREAATALLRELEPGQKTIVLNMLQEAQNTGTQGFEERLAYIEMMRAMMDDLQQIERNYGYNFIYTIYNQLPTQWYGNVSNNSLPSLFDATEAGSLAPGWEIPKDNLSDQAAYWRDDQLVALQQRRRECYIDLLKAICVSSDQYGLDAFEKLTAYLDFSKATVDDEELFQLARSVLKQQASSYNSYSSSELRGTGRHALEYYVMELHRRKDWSDAEQLMEKMTSSLMRQPLQNLLSLRRIGDEGGFNEKFKERLGQGSGYQGIPGPTWQELALRMYYLDGGDEGIDEVIWQFVERKSTQNIEEYVTLINAWVGAAQYVDRPVDIENIYSRLLENVFTDEEMEVFAKASPGSIDYNNHSSIYQKYQQLAEVFSQTPLPPEAIRTVLASTAQFDNKMRESSLSQYLANANRNDMVDFDWLRRVGFLDDWDVFPFQFFTGGQQSFASRIINQLRGNNRNEILKELENPDSQGFGKTVLATLMKSRSSNRRGTELLSALAPYREPLEADPERRNLLFGWIQDALLNNRGMLVQEDFSKPEDNASLLELYSAWSREALLAQLPAVESMKLSTLARDSYTELRQAGRIMRALAQTDLERAQALCNRLIKMSGIYYAINGQQNAEQEILQYLFNESGYTEGEFQLAATAVAGMKSPEAHRWFTEQYCSSMFSRAYQRYQERGMQYQQAQLEAAKDCIRAVSGIGGEIPFSAYFRWLQQIDQQSYPALASWIEKMDDKPSALNLLVVLLNPTENSDQIQAYLMDEKNAVEDRVQLYTWLSQRFSDRLPMLRQLEFNQAMIKLYDGVDNVWVPQQMYRILLEQVISLEDGEERDAWVDRLLGLWKDDKVDGAQYDTYNLSKLLEVAATAGRLDELRVSMGNQNMQRDPMVYALALRQGWYDWVAERLPNNIRNTNSRILNGSDMWIPADAVEHFEPMLESIKSDETRAVVRLFLSALPVKGDDGNAAVDKARIEEAFALADETLEDRELIQWVIGQYRNLRPASNLPNLKQSILKSRDMYLIQQIFGNGTFSEGDFEVLASAVAEMDSPDLRQWFTEQYCYSMFSRAYQRNQERGMQYQQAGLEAAKDCIRAVSGISDGVPLATYLRWLQQINQESYPALASWIEQMDDKPSALNLLVVLLNPTENADQIQAYLMDEKNAVEDRLQLYTWLSQRFSDRLPMLRQLEFNQAMIKLYDGVDNVWVPQQMYRILLEQVISLEDGEERDAWIDRLIGLWKDEKVDGSQYDINNLSKLLEVAATAGRLDEVRVYMENQNIQRDPSVYVFALRQGWYDWVAERLPNNIRNMNGRNLNSSDMWIPADAVEHFEPMLESIKSDEAKVVVRLFLSALPVKGDDGNAAVDKARIEEAFALADETLEDRELIRWVVGQYGSLRPASNLPKLKQSILKSRDMNLIQQIFQYGTFSEGDFGLLASAVAEMDFPDFRQWFTGQYCSSMFSRAYQRNQERGMQYQQAQLEAAKDCIRAVAGIGDGVPFSTYFRWIQQIDQQSYPALASWIEQMDDTPSPLNLLVVLLNPTGNTDQVQAYLMDEKNTVEDRLQVYTWIAQRFSDRLPMLRKLEFNQAMIKLYDGVDNVRVPQQMYRILLEQVISLENGEERDAWVDRLLGLWKDEKVDGTQYDTYSLSKLLEVVATAGRLDEVRVSMENQNMLRQPITYVLALRQGWYDWVAERLPGNVLNLNREMLHSPELWVPASAPDHYESILEQVKDPDLRLAVEIILSGLPVKDAEGTVKVDQKRLTNVLALADESLDEMKMINWTLNTAIQIQSTNNMVRLSTIVAESMDIAQAFNIPPSLNGVSFDDWVETRSHFLAYLVYIDSLADNGDVDKFRKVVEKISQIQFAQGGMDLERDLDHLLKALFINAERFDDAALKEQIEELKARLERDNDATRKNNEPQFQGGGQLMQLF